jgi:hypothetical protein
LLKVQLSIMTLLETALPSGLPELPAQAHRRA